MLCSLTRFPTVGLVFPHSLLSFFSLFFKQRGVGWPERRLRFEFSNLYNSLYTPFVPFTPPARRGAQQTTCDMFSYASLFPLLSSSTLLTRRIALPIRGKRIGPSEHRCSSSFSLFFCVTVLAFGEIFYLTTALDRSRDFRRLITRSASTLQNVSINEMILEIRSLDLERTVRYLGKSNETVFRDVYARLC